MNRVVCLLLLCGMVFSQRALAVSDYDREVRALSNLYTQARRPRLEASVFARIDWVQRTALLNVVCAAEPRPRCLEAVTLGLTDNALVVRDHAFRLLLRFADVSDGRKTDAARAIVADDRNYRRGQGLWIVERAKTYLSAEAP